MANPNRESNVGNKGKTGNVNERESMQGGMGQQGQRNVGQQGGMGGQSGGGYSSQNVGGSQQRGMGGSQMGGGNAGGMKQGWDQFRGRLREKWNTLQEQDLDRFGRNRDQLIGHINERAGGNRQEIERDVDRFSRETGYRFE